MTAKTWDELYGEGAKDNTPNTLAFALTDVEEDKLVGYTPKQLTTLVRRLLCELGTASLMTKEETAQAMLDTLANTALRPIVAGLNMKADIQARMAAIDKWLDRERGKPAQSQAIELKVKGEMAHTHNIELSSELLKEQLQRILKKSPVVIDN